MSATTGNDSIVLSGGNNSLDALAGSDSILGNSGDNTLFGNLGNDTLAGAAGNDWIMGGPDADSLVGGSGLDTLSYASDTVGVTIALGGGAGLGGDAAGDVFTGFEAVVGGSGADCIIGSTSADTLTGGGGEDTLVASAGSHFVDAGIGNDSLVFGSGDDSLFGDDGNDTLVGGAGRDTLLGDLGNDSLVGGGGAASFDGGTLDDTIAAGGGAGTIVISAGNDSIDAGGGDDLVYFNDQIGRATIDGGAGNDTLDLGVLFDDGSWEVGTAGAYTTYTLGNGGLAPPTVIYAAAFEAVLCFAAGTRIATPSGEVMVERLGVGDLVLSSAGVQPVLWAGRLVAELARHPRPEQVRPIRIRAGAFADGVPKRDLWVSPDHGMLLDGVLVPAKFLVNGETISQDPWGKTIAYHHIELASHAAVYAEGALAESYLEDGARHLFEDVVPLLPDLSPVRRAEGFCPVVTDAAAASPWRARFAVRAAVQRRK